MGFPQFESAHKKAPFSRNTTEIAEIYFPGAPAEQVGNFTVVSGTEGSHVIIQEMKIYEEANNNNVYDPGEVVYENYNLFIFVCKDTAELQEAFENFKPAANDVCIFLEDNSSDIFSGSSAWIRQSKSNVIVGDKVKDELSQWFSGSGDAAFDQFQQLGKQFGFNLDISQDEMTTLINEGEVRDAQMTLFLTIFQVFNGINILAAPLYTEIAKLLSETTAFLRDVLKFKDYHWDPNAKIPTGKDQEMVENTNFEPVLMPFSYTVLEGLAYLEDAGVKLVTSTLRQELLKSRQAIQGRLSSLQNFGASAGIVIPQSILDYVNQAATLVNDLLRRMIDNCEKSVEQYASYSKTWVNSVNAFNCGLWNSLVEIVLGFVDFLGLIFTVFGFVGNSIKDAQRLVPETLEVIDEFIQAFFKVDFVSILDQIMNAFFAMLSKINLSAFFAGLTAERIAYFLGGLMGTIVESILDVAFTGGSKAVLGKVTKIKETFGAIGESVYTFVKRSVSAAISVSTNPWECLLALAKKIIAILKKGGQQLVRMFQSVFEIVVKGGILAENIVSEIYRVFKITRQEQKAL
ncbi:MAG TPA: hypothetical protein VLH08_13730, partial [Acidobacteriota bacterium]|nr:hypothetical protein [Acidobacteriota bacterium]